MTYVSLPVSLSSTEYYAQSHTMLCVGTVLIQTSLSLAGTTAVASSPSVSRLSQLNPSSQSATLVIFPEWTPDHAHPPTNLVDFMSPDG